MNVNLIPSERRTRARVRGRRTRWIVVCGGYGLFVAISAGTACFGSPNEARAVAGNIEQARSDRTATELIARQLEESIGRARTSVTINRSFVERPDWSVLLAFIADLCREDVALSRCATVTGAGGSDDEGERKPNATGRNVVLELQGLGRDQEAVARFVLRLEGLPLFRQVKLVDTRREPFLDGHATAFRLESIISAAAPAKEATP